MAKESAVAPTTFLPPEQSRELFLVLGPSADPGRAPCPPPHLQPPVPCPRGGSLLDPLGDRGFLEC